MGRPALTRTEKAHLVLILAGAAIDIGTYGHRKHGGATTADGPRDAVSAISLSAAQRGHRVPAVAEQQAAACLALLARHLREDPAGWNDADERTADQVIDALYDTAEEVLRRA